MSSANCNALLIAYIALLGVVVLYLAYSRPMQTALYTALRKYESRVQALDVPRGA